MPSFDPLAHKVTSSITVTNTSTGVQALSSSGITVAQMNDSDVMMITPQADIYWLPTGTVTSSLYHILSAGKTYTFSGLNLLRNMKLLRAGAANVVCTVSLFKVNEGNVHL